MVVASDHFDNGTFEEDDDRGAGDDDAVSFGSEENAYDSSDDEDDDEGTGEEEPEGNASVPQVEQENDDADGSSASDEKISGDQECRDGTMGRTVNNADARFSYTAEELRKMKLAHERSLSRQWGWRDQNDQPRQQNRITAHSSLRGPLARHSRPFAPPVLAR